MEGNAVPNRSVVGSIHIAKEIYNDAYRIAVEHGFEGTEEEWLASLKGEPGYTPQRGKDYWTEEDKAEIESYIDGKMTGMVNATVE